MEVTEDHIKLLQHMTFDWDDEIEWGAVSSDPKRPFGNSNVEGDVSEILGREVDFDEARHLTIELSAVVDAIVNDAVNGNALPAVVAVGIELDLPRRAANLLGWIRTSSSPSP